MAVIQGTARDRLGQRQLRPRTQRNHIKCNCCAEERTAQRSSDRSRKCAAGVARLPVKSILATRTETTVRTRSPTSLMIKYFVCDLCGKRFASKRHLDQHVDTHSAIRRFACGLCDKKFYTQCVLKAHQKTHAGKKPHACDICGKCFARNSILVRHARTHSGERPFKCEQCGARFPRHDVLKYHQKTHSATKPFKCGTCGWLCFKKSDLSHHGCFLLHRIARKPAAQRGKTEEKAVV